MSPAVRALALIVVGWAGVRAATLHAIPGAELFTLGRSEARTAAAPPSAFPPLEPAVPLDAAWAMAAPASRPAFPAWQVQSVAVPVYIPVPRYTVDYMPVRQSAPAPFLYPSVASLQDWPIGSLAVPLPAAASTASATTALPVAPAPLKQTRFDRLQLTAWALLRGRQPIGAPPQSLATGGSLGGSQAGARLTYRFTPELAASVRTTSAVGTSQSEVAAGLRVTPLRSIPVSITLERRQAIGRYGGRSAFALFAEGGLYGQSLWGFDIDAYAQGGVIGARKRAYFADGAFAFTRPLFRQASAGFGVWGGIQPGVYRVDAGPRLSYRVRPNIRVHLDWRQRIAGTALPGSGPAVTLAADF